MAEDVDARLLAPVTPGAPAGSSARWPAVAPVAAWSVSLHGCTSPLGPLEPPEEQLLRSFVPSWPSNVTQHARFTLGDCFGLPPLQRLRVSDVAAIFRDIAGA